MIRYLRKIVLNKIDSIVNRLLSRNRLLKKLDSLSYLYEGYILNSNISPKAKVNKPCNITDSNIDDYSYVAEGSKLSLVTVGKFCSLGPNILAGYGIHPLNSVSTSPIFYSTLNQAGTTLSTTDKIEERKPIAIGNDVFIGANVTILDGVTIGDGAVIGAGAVVSKDIPPYAIAVGCPIKIIKYRFDEKTINRLLEIKWWDLNEVDLKKVEIDFFDIEKFLRECEDR